MTEWTWRLGGLFDELVSDTGEQIIKVYAGPSGDPCLAIHKDYKEAIRKTPDFVRLCIRLREQLHRALHHGRITLVLAQGMLEELEAVLKDVPGVSG